MTCSSVSIAVSQIRCLWLAFAHLGSDAFVSAVSLDGSESYDAELARDLEIDMERMYVKRCASCLVMDVVIYLPDYMRAKL